MRKIEKEEEQIAYDEPDKKIYHLCIVNLVIGTLYCAKGNYEFGISRVIKSLEPYQKKVTTSLQCAVMVVCDLNKWQSIFMIFILSNTTRLAPFPYGGTRIQGSAKMQRMLAMIAQADLDNLSKPVHAHTLIVRFIRE